MIANLEPDLYGPYARASLIADYVELLALKNPVRRETVVDFLSDSNGWDLELIQESEDNSSDYQETALSEWHDQAQEKAAIVFELMEERRCTLAERYPFAITDGMVSCDPNIDYESNPYLAILSLTIAHAFNVSSSQKPTELFEQMVTKVLRDRGLRSVGVAAARRTSNSFSAALSKACDTVGLKANPHGAAIRRKAHDEGVDILCHFSWDDDLRANAWVFIGQVTVGRSDIWVQKIKEPSPLPWANLVGIQNQPLPFLAVPHHVESPMMEKLGSDGDGVVLDRLRLAKFKCKTDSKERDIIRAVAQESVEPLSG